MLNLDGDEVRDEAEEKPASATKLNPFTFVEAITFSKDESLMNEETIRSYNAYLINKALSFHPDTVHFANVMNQYPDVPVAMQFRFYLDLIRKRKRYGWIKKTEDSEKIDTIKAFYKYSTAKAMEIAHLLTDADITDMRNRMSTGGVKHAARSSSTKKSSKRVSTS